MIEIHVNIDESWSTSSVRGGYHAIVGGHHILYGHTIFTY
jgi:hypothetical protein